MIFTIPIIIRKSFKLLSSSFHHCCVGLNNVWTLWTEFLCFLSTLLLPNARLQPFPLFHIHGEFCDPTTINRLCNQKANQISISKSRQISPARVKSFGNKHFLATSCHFAEQLSKPKWQLLLQHQLIQKTAKVVDDDMIKKKGVCSHHQVCKMSF